MRVVGDLPKYRGTVSKAMDFFPEIVPVLLEESLEIRAEKFHADYHLLDGPTGLYY